MNLKRLVIVNCDEDEMLTAKYRDKPAETESLVPESFRRCRDRVRKELREDTSWLDEILD